MLGLLAVCPLLTGEMLDHFTLEARCVTLQAFSLSQMKSLCPNALHLKLLYNAKYIEME